MRPALGNIVVIVVALGAAVAGQQVAQFSTATDLVVLHVNVKDKRGAYVTGLPQQAFAVFEDGRPQDIRFFSSEDAPVTVGLLVDSSASMYDDRDLVIAAAAAFAEAGNPRDERFALTFNERVRRALPATKPFTSDLAFFRDALARVVVPSGRTALFDAVSTGLEYLNQGQYDRRDLIVLSDGGDNASRTSFNEVIARTQASNALIYTVAVRDRAARDGNPKLLERLARATGGEAFTAKNPRDITAVLRHIALDVRQTYTIGYVSTNPARDGTFRHVRVAVNAPDDRSIVVRARDGYRAGAPSAAAPPPASIAISCASKAIDLRVERVAPSVPVYRFAITNRSTRALVAFQYETSRGAARALTGRRKNDRNEPLAMAGGRYTFEIQPGSAIDRASITSVLWDDGTIEGDGALAADERVLDIGKAVQIRRVLKLLHEFADRTGDPAVSAFRAKAVALPLTGEVPYTDASRTGMQQVKDALMRDLDVFERAQASRTAVTFATWVADTTAGYEEWLARIVSR
jgi:Ca-activated chloride channel homolog